MSITLFFFFYKQRCSTPRWHVLPVWSFLKRVLITVPCSFTWSHSLTISPADTKCSTSRSAISCNLENATIWKKKQKQKLRFQENGMQQDLWLIHSPFGAVFHTNFCVQNVHHSWVIVHIFYPLHLQLKRLPFCYVPDRRQQKSTSVVWWQLDFLSS